MLQRSLESEATILAPASQSTVQAEIAALSNVPLRQARRNGGFVDASLTHGLQNGKARWPNEIDTLEAMGRQNIDGMQADIESLGLDA